MKTLFPHRLLPIARSCDPHFLINSVLIHSTPIQDGFPKRYCRSQRAFFPRPKDRSHRKNTSACAKNYRVPAFF